MNGVTKHPNDTTVDCPFVPKAHLYFGGMYIDINRFWFERQEKQSHRLSILSNHRVERFCECCAYDVAADGSLIKKKELIGSVRLCEFGFPD